MHGRPKLIHPPTSAEIQSDSQKSITYQRLVDIINLKRSQADYSIETFGLIEQFLKKNPDYYSLWNYRKEILLHLYPTHISSTPSPSPPTPLSSLSSSVAPEQIDEICQKELALSTAAILKNPKSYGAWYHRVWIIQRFPINISSEIELCSQFLSADQRNFHCWNYRRYLVQYYQISPELEYQYTTNKLSENFSNYSSYHHRSVYLPKHLSTAVTCHTDLTTILELEFQLIENAIFTEPDDQSAWWYYIFILQYISHLLRSSHPSPSSSSSSSSSASSTCPSTTTDMASVPLPSITSFDWKKLIIFILENYFKQYSSLKELQAMEMSCKWILIGLLTLIQSIEDILFSMDSSNFIEVNGLITISTDSEFSWNCQEKGQEYEEYFSQLCEIDSNRKKCHQYRFGRGKKVE